MDSVIIENVENPFVIRTDREFIEMIEILEKIEDLTDTEINLLKVTKAVGFVKEEGSLSFELEDLIEFAKMTENHSNHSNQIMACIDYLVDVCEFEGETSPEFYLSVVQTFGSLIPSKE